MRYVIRKRTLFYICIYYGLLFLFLLFLNANTTHLISFHLQYHSITITIIYNENNNDNIQRRHGIYEYLSGVPVTERTQFLALNDSRDYEHFQSVIHYMYYAIASYGWPMFIMTHSKTGICELGPNLRCCNLLCFGRQDNAKVIEDNCCLCNYAALKQMLAEGDVEIIYVTYHVDIGETPFFVAVDYAREKIVVSIRGTLSMKDVLTDLNAEGEYRISSIQIF